MTPRVFCEQLHDQLNWNSSELSGRIAKEFQAALLTNWTSLVSRIAFHDNKKAETVELLAAQLAESEFLRFLSYPHIAGLLVADRAVPLIDIEVDYVLVEIVNRVSASGCVEGQPTPLRPISLLLPIPQMERGGNKLSSLYGQDIDYLALNYIHPAMNIIGALRPSAMEFAVDHTAVLLVLRENSDPGRFASGSFRRLPGLTLILNCDAASSDPWVAADAVMHEAVHSIIYKFESLNSRLITRKFARKISSPWTGAKLPIESFVQACFVWYALANLWRGATCAQAQRLYQRASLGFACEKYMQSVESIGPTLAEGVGDVLLALAGDIGTSVH